MNDLRVSSSRDAANLYVEHVFPVPQAIWTKSNLSLSIRANLHDMNWPVCHMALYYIDVICARMVIR